MGHWSPQVQGSQRYRLSWRHSCQTRLVSDEIHRNRALGNRPDESAVVISRKELVIWLVEIVKPGHDNGTCRGIAVGPADEPLDLTWAGWLGTDRRGCRPCGFLRMRLDSPDADAAGTELAARATTSTARRRRVDGDENVRLMSSSRSRSMRAATVPRSRDGKHPERATVTDGLIRPGAGPGRARVVRKPVGQHPGRPRSRRTATHARARFGPSATARAGGKRKERG